MPLPGLQHQRRQPGRRLERSCRRRRHVRRSRKCGASRLDARRPQDDLEAKATGARHCRRDEDRREEPRAPVIRDFEVLLNEVMTVIIAIPPSVHPATSVVESVASFEGPWTPIQRRLHPSNPPPIEFGCGDLMVRLDVRLPGDPAAITPVVESVLTMAHADEMRRGQGVRDRDRPPRSTRECDSLRLPPRPVAGSAVRGRLRPVPRHADRRAGSRARLRPVVDPQPDRRVRTSSPITAAEST